MSSDARVWPAVTVSPTATATDATVPLTGNATVACETGSMVATPFWRESTLRVATVADAEVVALAERLGGDHRNHEHRD